MVLALVNAGNGEIVSTGKDVGKKDAIMMIGAAQSRHTHAPLWNKRAASCRTSARNTTRVLVSTGRVGLVGAHGRGASIPLHIGGK